MRAKLKRQLKSELIADWILVCGFPVLPKPSGNVLWLGSEPCVCGAVVDPLCDCTATRRREGGEGVRCRACRHVSDSADPTSRMFKSTSATAHPINQWTENETHVENPKKKRGFQGGTWT